MANGAHAVDIMLPRSLHRRLQVAAKAAGADVNSLILTAVKADVRAFKKAARKKTQRKP